MYKELRRLVAGTQDSKHSLNQKRLKRIVHSQRRFLRGAPKEFASIESPRVALTETEELRRTLATGVYGTGARAELEAAVHLVGSVLNRAHPFQSY